MNTDDIDKQLDEVLNKYVSNYNLDVLGFRQSGQHTVKQSLRQLIQSEVRKARKDELQTQWEWIIQCDDDVAYNLEKRIAELDRELKEGRV